MSAQSSYLRYLPPVLWEKEVTPGQVALGDFLCIFEKMLTGLADGETIRHPLTALDEEGVIHQEREHEPVVATIARLHQLFDPRYTPPAYLTWLAAWVGLTFPKVPNQALQETDLWDEAMRRKVTGEIVQIYRQRGLRAGIKRYLDLYTAPETRPRIALDDGSKVLFTQPVAGAIAAVAVLIAQPQTVDLQDANAIPFKKGLHRPICLATAADGALFIADQGGFGFENSVWRLDARPNGGTLPQLVGPPAWRPPAIKALVVRGNAPEELFVLDQTSEIYRLQPPAFATVTSLTKLRNAFPDLNPVAMAVDNNAHLLILDATQKRIIDVQIDPLQVTAHTLTTVITPLSLLVLPDNTLVIGDGRQQKPAPGTGPLLPPEQLAGNLVRVDRSDAANWQETLLLSPTPLTANPLVAPTALVREDDQHLLVLDAGLKPFAPTLTDPFIVQVAAEASIYRVDLASRTVVMATESGHFVYPTGMARHADTLFVCDPGYPEGEAGKWRRRPYEFRVFVHFTRQRLPPNQQARTILASIRDVIAREKPAHTYGTVVSDQSF